jgi:SOS-response transcriptional repressor LexA
MARTRHMGFRQQQVLAYVERTLRSDGQAPSYRMIRDELGMWSKANVSRTVQSLERDGLLKRVGAGRVRRIRLP